MGRPVDASGALLDTCPRCGACLADDDGISESCFACDFNDAHAKDEACGVEQDARAALVAAISSLSARLAASETRVGELERALRGAREALEWALGHDECVRDEANLDPSEDGDSPMAATMRTAIAAIDAALATTPPRATTAGGLPPAACGGCGHGHGKATDGEGGGDGE